MSTTSVTVNCTSGTTENAGSENVALEDERVMSGPENAGPALEGPDST